MMLMPVSRKSVSSRCARWSTSRGSTAGPALKLCLRISGLQERVMPAGAAALEELAVVQAMIAVVPEFDAVWVEPEPTPRARPRRLALAMFGAQRGEARLELGAIGDGLALL